MLDQNTDRMWYVIGAVIVGAAIIFLANSTLPSLFASVTDSFSESADGAVSVIEDVNVNVLTADRLEASNNAEIVGYTSGTWTVDILPTLSNYSRGLQVVRERIHIPYGKSFNVSYEVFSPIALDVSTDINSRASQGESWRASDNDNHSTRRFNGEHSVVGVDHAENLAPFKFLPIPAGEWTTITFSYDNTSEENEEHVDIYDYSVFGVRNRTDDTIQIQIRNIKGWIGETGG